MAPGPVWTPLVVQSLGAEKNAHFGEDSPMRPRSQEALIAEGRGHTPPELHHAIDQALHVGFGSALGAGFARATRRARGSTLTCSLGFGAMPFSLARGW